MDIETLKNFIVIAESGSISQAARKLYVAQSALSNRLKALEKECGARLIERDYHNFRLTESGRILYERALKITELVGAAISDVRTADTGEAGTLNIAVTPSLATGILRDVLKVFRAKYPAVNVKIYEGATPSLLSRIEDGVCDIALVRTPYTDSAAYETKEVGCDRMVVLSCEIIPKTFGYAELFGKSLILTHRYAAMLERTAERCGLRLNAPLQCEEIATCISLAEAGLGTTMIPESTFESHRRHGMTLHHAVLSERDCDTHCELLWMKNRRLSAAAANFADVVKSELLYPDTKTY